ncbi:Protein of unknown function [Bacillus wiedmannii]|nr:Protein of unknown function [Bacillus wiedmannii]
MPIGGGEDSGK